MLKFFGFGKGKKKKMRKNLEKGDLKNIKNKEIKHKNCII